jgi:cytochrome c5
MNAFNKSFVWAVSTVCSAAILLAQPQTQFPDGPGKAILERACGSCHAADTITQHHFATKDEYRDIVNSMIGSGAVVSPTELPVLVDYLFANWGKKPEGGAAPPAAAEGGPDPGKTILESACSTCHGLDSLANHKYDTKEPYQSLVVNMVAYGASVSEAQMGPLVDYLFKTYGNKK